MSTEFAHGVRMIISDDGYKRLRVPSTSIIALVATSSDADDEFYPENQCVLVNDITTAISKAGTKGTLRNALEDIDKEVRATLVVVRVPEGENEESTIANVIGTVEEDGTMTGLEALNLASQRAGVQPRIFICPKYDEDLNVTLKLGTIAKKYYGMAYSGLFNKCESISEALTLRDKVSNECLMGFYNNGMAYDTELEATSERYSVAQIAGLRASLDIEKGWHWSISNHHLEQITGTNKEVTYEPINPVGTGANELNAQGISLIVQDQGFKTWGNRTLSSDDSPYYFEVSTRSAQVIAITLANLMKDLLQDKPMSPQLLEIFRVRGNRLLDDWTRATRILGGRVVLDPQKNGVDDLMVGRPDWAVEFTPAVPIESPGLTVSITDEFVMNAVA